MNKIVKNKINKGIMLVIIVVAFSFSLAIMLKYKHEGETNMPFTLKKILVVSSAEANSKEENQENLKWNLNVNQYNDIYLELQKNENYNKESYIESVTLENFNIQNPKTGNVEIYMPNSTEQKLFSYEEHFKITGSLTYKGANQNNEKTLNIANQGGTVLFRVVNKNIADYKSNEGDEISYDGKLLEKTKTNIEDITFSVSFDIIIKTDKSTFKGNTKLELPYGNIIQDGVTTKNVENIENIIFKRIVQ